MPKKYRASQTSAEIRSFAASVLVGLEKRGVKRNLAFEAMREAGYAPSLRTVRRHKKRASSGEDVFSREKAPGHPPTLDEAEREICAGFVLAQNIAHKDVHLADYIRFISKNFNVKVSRSTASRYLELTGFSSRIVQPKASGYKSDISISRFTNCIITVVWADGVNRTPPVLFTLNQLLRFDRHSTPKRDREVVLRLILEVATAQNAAMGIERTSVRLRGQRLVSVAALIKSLGGG